MRRPGSLLPTIRPRVWLVRRRGPPSSLLRSQKSEKGSHRQSFDAFNTIKEHVDEFVIGKKGLNLRPCPLEKFMELLLPYISDSQMHNPWRDERNMIRLEKSASLVTITYPFDSAYSHNCESVRLSPISLTWITGSRGLNA